MGTATRIAELGSALGPGETAVLTVARKKRGASVPAGDPWEALEIEIRMEPEIRLAR